MAQDEEKFPANTEVFKGESDEVLRHRARNSDEKRFNQCFPSYDKAGITRPSGTLFREEGLIGKASPS